MPLSVLKHTPPAVVAVNDAVVDSVGAGGLIPVQTGVDVWVVVSSVVVKVAEVLVSLVPTLLQSPLVQSVLQAQTLWTSSSQQPSSHWQQLPAG